MSFQHVANHLGRLIGSDKLRLSCWEASGPMPLRGVDPSHMGGERSKRCQQKIVIGSGAGSRVRRYWELLAKYSSTAASYSALSCGESAS